MLRSGDHLAPLPTKLTAPPQQRSARGNNWQPPPQESRCCNAAATQHRIAAMGYCCNALAHCGNARIAAMPQRIAAIPVSMLVLLQYCRNADAACNALQHCRSTYCRNIEAHCRNAPFVASLRQCCYCKGHCGNAPLALPQHPNIFQMIGYQSCPICLWKYWNCKSDHVLLASCPSIAVTIFKWCVQCCRTITTYHSTISHFCREYFTKW